MPHLRDSLVQHQTLQDCLEDGRLNIRGVGRQGWQEQCEGSKALCRQSQGAGDLQRHALAAAARRQRVRGQLWTKCSGRLAALVPTSEGGRPLARTMGLLQAQQEVGQCRGAVIAEHAGAVTA